MVLPKGCPKCGGVMKCVAILVFPELPLKENEPIFTVGYSCFGKYDSYERGFFIVKPIRRQK